MKEGTKSSGFKTLSSPLIGKQDTLDTKKIVQCKRFSLLRCVDKVKFYPDFIVTFFLSGYTQYQLFNNKKDLFFAL